MNASIDTSAASARAGFGVLDRMLRKRLLEVVGHYLQCLFGNLLKRVLKT